jgi:hypothetical protein
MSKTTQDMDEILKEYKDAKSKEDALTPIYLKQESEEFAKKWIASGLPIYDKSGNLIVKNNDDKKKAPKKKN